MFMCTVMFLLKTAYGYGKRMFMRRLGDYLVYTYQFHVLCGSCVFLVSTFAGSIWGRSKMEPDSCKLSYIMKNMTTSPVTK